MRARFFWITAVVVLVLLAVAAVGLNGWVSSYLRSSEFRELIEARTSEALRAETTLSPLVWSGSSVFSEQLASGGTPGSPLSSLEAKQLRANVNWRSIFDGAWRIERLDVTRLDARVRRSDGNGSRLTDLPATPATTRKAAPWRSWLPNRFEIGEVVVQDANLTVPDAASLRRTELTVRPDGSGWTFDGRGGEVDLAQLPGLTIEQFRLRLQEDVWFLTEASLRRGEAGRIELSGEIGGPRQPVNLRAEWNQLEARDLLDNVWRERLQGQVAGVADFTGGGGKPIRTAGRYVVTEGSLEGIPMQRQIARFTRSPQFERIPLHEWSGDFVVEEGATTVENFVLESRGLVKLTGRIQIDADQSLRGTLRIGLTPQTLHWLPGSRERVFTDSENGYLWTDLEVGGTVENPTEDLSDRLIAATAEEVIDAGVQLIDEAPDRARDAVKDIYDLFSPLLR